jgi:hypothetical protein
LSPLARSTPSTKSRIDTTPLSLSRAVTETRVPASTVAPSAGSLIATCGGLESPSHTSLLEALLSHSR